jgi:hypothetical protein
MKPEQQLRIQILGEVGGMATGQVLMYHKDPVVVDVAKELLFDGLVTGQVDEYGMVTLTGIRDAGREYLKSQQPHQRVLRVGKRALFILYSCGLLAAGYILNLDSVKKFFSDLAGKFLK